MAKLFYYYFSLFWWLKCCVGCWISFNFQIRNSWGVFMVSISEYFWIVKRMFRQLKTPKQQIQIAETENYLHCTKPPIVCLRQQLLFVASNIFKYSFSLNDFSFTVFCFACKLIERKSFAICHFAPQTSRLALFGVWKEYDNMHNACELLQVEI